MPAFTTENQREFQDALNRGTGADWLAAHPLPSWSDRHPAWTLLDHATAGPDPLGGADALRALLQAGWHPERMEDDPPFRLSRRQRRQWYRPLDVHPGGPAPSLFARLVGFSDAAAQAWSGVLLEHGHRPADDAWKTAAGRACMPLLETWEAEGCAVPAPDALWDAFLRPAETLAFRRPPSRVHPLVAFLAARGWRPTERDWQDVLQADHAPALLGLLTRFPEGNPSWTKNDWACALRVLWGYEDEPPEVQRVTAVLLKNPVVQAALPQPTPDALPEWLTAEGDDRSAPPWVTLLVPPSAAKANVWRQVAPWVPKPAWNGRVAAEWWAALRESPKDVAVYGLPLGPNPDTGRWPAAGAPAAVLEAWMAEGGGWDEALRDERGPLPEIAARTVRERDAERENLLLAHLDRRAMGRIGTRMFEGVSLSDWCAGRPRMAQRFSGDGRSDDALHAAVLAASVPQVRRLLQERPPRAPALGSDLIAVALRQRWSNHEDLLKRVAHVVGLLHEAGAPWPRDPELWHTSSLFLKPGAGNRSPSRRCAPLDTWTQWRDWPDFLAGHWVNTAVDTLQRVTRSRRSPTTTLGRDTLWRSLENAEAAAPAAVVQALLDRGNEDEISSTPVIVVSPSAVLHVDYLTDIVQHAMVAWGERPWAAATHESIAQWETFSPDDGHQEEGRWSAGAWAAFWNGHAPVRALFAHLQLQLSLPEASPSPERTRNARRL